MINIENELGSIEISQEYFANLVGKAASECFGVAGMVSSPSQGLRSAALGKDVPDKGVRVRTSGGGLVIDLHIVVVYGMNISAIVKSIVNKVRYTVEQATGLDVAKVNVFVDEMKTENA
ncbi:Asp23/Gls24 family envelope stress response protein [Youxingia wuxianensis]|uniref:Asp23/Gls24 family envelope stress response protein n=1 Tax=Youxingia wuxianensis TaxID=2763678 RepID=A0A926EL92_9FIRM|nr:Asp23/Gls24 family envelope stress response protein [Youxingia wuxianensis]MBC8584666.1 Asp23/Gls24 family envelope stress response protein [Youxingia wuxianensis]